MNSTPTLALAAAAAAALLLSGCVSTSVPPSDAPQGMTKLTHIHQLVAGEEPGILLAATHEGLYRVPVDAPSGTKAAGPIGGLDFDPMGFTIADGTAYASGHPGPTTPKTFGSPNLGLITSRDIGATWTNVALTGTTDFHGLAVMTAGGGPARVFGIDESNKRIERSLDGGVTWSAGPSLVARDIRVVATTLYATTPDGLAVSNDMGATFTLDPTAPALFLLAADKESTLVGVDTSGTLWTRSVGQNWTSGHALTGTGLVQALAADGSRIFVADDRGISFTENIGATWTSIKVHK